MKINVESGCSLGHRYSFQNECKRTENPIFLITKFWTGLNSDHD